MAPIANDDDTITIGELRAYFSGRSFADRVTDEIAEWIFEHREPEYAEGTVVKDSSGFFWRHQRDWRCGSRPPADGDHVTCKDCGKKIYWVDDLSLWYHRDLRDMLTCPAVTIEPAET